MAADDVIAAFGEPEIYIENDSIEYGADAPEWMYFDISNGNTVASFSANAGEFTLNGQSLKQDFDSLASLIGDNYDSLGAGGCQWIRNGICYTFYIPDDTEEPYSINVYRIDDDDPIDNDAYLGEEGNSGTYGNLDSALVGRWRSFDGGTLQFDDNGVISSCDFKCWSMNGEPERIYWEASNGRVTCSAYFDSDVIYEIEKWSDGDELLSLTYPEANGWQHDFRRTSGVTGDGIIGMWISTLIKKEKTPFQIKKHLVDDVAASERQEYEIRSTDEVSGIRFNSNGEASGLWSSEIPFDAETDGYFSYVFYEVPNPFDAGDVVRLVGTEDYGIVEVSQKQWNDDLVKWKNPEWLQKGLYVDYSDVQIRVIFLCEDGTFSHSHINPVDLELYRPDQDSQDPVDSARDQLLQAASLLYRKDDSSSVIGSLEDLYVYTMKYRNVKGAEN